MIIQYFRFTSQGTQSLSITVTNISMFLKEDICAILISLGGAAEGSSFLACYAIFTGKYRKTPI